MEAEEALFILRNIGITSGREGQAIGTAIKALEKQIPKKVKFEDSVFLGKPCKDPYCPSCGDNFNGGEWWYLDCCPECGQALDWRE